MSPQILSLPALVSLYSARSPRDISANIGRLQVTQGSGKTGKSSDTARAGEDRLPFYLFIRPGETHKYGNLVR